MLLFLNMTYQTRPSDLWTDEYLKRRGMGTQWGWVVLYGPGETRGEGGALPKKRPACRSTPIIGLCPTPSLPPYISTPISIPHTQPEPLLGDWVQKWGLASDIHQKLVLLEDPGMFQEGLKLAMLGRSTNKALFWQATYKIQWSISPKSWSESRIN